MPMMPTPPPAIMRTAMPTYAATQSNVSIKIDQPFQIHMNVTSGTGYTWQPSGPMPPGLTLLGVFQQPKGKMMPGGPGTEVLVFRGTAVGKFTLTLGYLRPWEKNVKPVKTQTFTVTVHK
jgi:predicted secreted protein